MKKISLFAVLLLTLSIAGFGQATKKMTVREFFLAIPNDVIKADAKKRATWITNEDDAIGNLSFEIPIKEIIPDADGEGSVFGSFQVFEMDGGGYLLGMANNMCADGECIGMLKFLSYKQGKWNDVSDDYLIIPDNDEVIATLKTSPAFKKPLKDGEQVPLAVEFNGNEKAAFFIAGCVKSCDGGVVAKQYKWNGTAFAEYEMTESPE